MMGLWDIRGQAHIARKLMHSERVWLRSLNQGSCPRLQLTLSVCISHLRRFDEQAPKEVQTTERVCSFIMATTLQSDHEGGETLSKNRRAGRSLLRVPPSGKRRPDYNLIRVERRNGAGASPPLVSGKCRRSTAASDHRCVQRSAHEKDLTRQAYLHKAGSHVRASAVQPTASPVARRVGSGGNKVNRTGGLQNG